VPQCCQNGLTDEICELLISLRQNFPGVYLREFGYYDTSLIYYWLIKGKKEEIPGLLQNFETYPENFPEQLFDLLDVMTAVGESGIVFPLLLKIHKQVCNSHEIIGGIEILDYMIWHIEGQYLLPTSTKESFVSLCNAFNETIEFELEERFSQVSYWESLHNTMFSDSTLFKCNKKSKKVIYEAYSNLTNQFTGYLFQNVSKKWEVNNMASHEISRFLSYLINDKHILPPRLFCFEKKVIDSFIADSYKNYFWLHACKTNLFLTALWHFVAFLVKTGNITEAEMNIVRQHCMEFHKLEQKINDGYLESAIFKEFPLF
jgi:hypothetical protein